MHGLCFLLERVEASEDCLAGPPAAAPPTGDVRGVSPADGNARQDTGDAGDTARDGASAHGSSVGRGGQRSGQGGQQQQQQQRRRFGPLSGQIISVVRIACRASMLCCPVRLVEAFYRCRYVPANVATVASPHPDRPPPPPHHGRRYLVEVVVPRLAGCLPALDGMPGIFIAVALG